ncbi:DUF1266 domain-containing protein [Streptomyces sp. V1I6]|uniref:DUF1266 domain-containing protein n=1 Tax=Streptomyces sp. V1I6 TaxID=3042273 RepID=UPI002786E533|nr:DUF1266 domain-containing protein [Streptomyces sp. V1I6]MDQ0842896.1 hypothetical protein [Streptomyces sp. V1I6]
MTAAAMPYGWQAPTEVEHRLHEAKTRGDWASFFDVLSGTYLYYPVGRADAEAGTGTHYSYRSPVTGTWCYAFYTEGALPLPQPDPVFNRTSFQSVVRTWGSDPCWLAVNPGTPGEAYFPANPQTLHLWRQHAERVTPRKKGLLRTLRVGGPTQGPVAKGLACGAQLAVHRGDLWNAPASHLEGFRQMRETLDESWGIRGADDWHRVQEDLLHGRYVSSEWEFVLSVRRAMAREYKGPVDPVHWRETAAHVMRRGAEPETVSEADIDGVRQLIGRITRYEARFRADGVLSEGRCVRSVLSWDHGRAAHMARWGLAARYCDPATAEGAVVRAGEASATVYRSWEDFGAGYALGRCLHFDEEEFGTWYTEVVDIHRTLTTDPESPWLTVPWQ